MKWKLNESNFTWADRLKICGFFLNPSNFWTMSKYVEEYESQMAILADARYAVYVSSGSTANTLVAMYLKDSRLDPTKDTVVFPSTTWITSVSPFIREGFKPKFIDINLTDFSIDTKKLESYLKKSHNRVAAVFVTSLIGFVPDIEELDRIGAKYGVRIMLDNCENTLGSYKGFNVSHYFTSTTSTYFGHQLQSVEGGFIFTSSLAEYKYFVMARNHGMVRSLPDDLKSEHANPDVDPRFDFNIVGNNFRNTDINAFIGLLDIKRAPRYAAKRIKLYKSFLDALHGDAVIAPLIRTYPSRFEDVPFCIPLICNNVVLRNRLAEYCNKHGIESRPIISGNLLRQTCLKNLAKPGLFENSETLHHRGLYVGLHPKLTEKQVVSLAKTIAN